MKKQSNADHDQYIGHLRAGASGFCMRRSSGWGLNLFRNPAQGKVAGVAAGLADYWDIAPWVVRLLWIIAFLFTGTLALWLYVAAWVSMAPRPPGLDSQGRPTDTVAAGTVAVDMEYDERHRDYRPRNVFRYSDSVSVRLHRAQERLAQALQRVEKMESYVTSRQYALNKEFSRL